MSKNYNISSITDAFLALNDIDDQEVSNMIKKPKSLDEGKSFGLFAGSQELQDAKDMLKPKRREEDEIEVIDPDADSLEHIRKNVDYIGQLILRCNRCKANRFVNIFDAKQEDDDEYSTEDECPSCHSIGQGYELVGQVGKFTPEEPQSQEAAAEVENTEEEATIDNQEEVSVENDSETDDIKFDNDIQDAEEIPAEESSEETSMLDDINNDNSDLGSDDDYDFLDKKLSVEDKEEEVDGMETDSEDVDDEEEKVGEEFDPDNKEEDEEDLDESFISESDYESEDPKLAKEAWLMNKVVQSINDEEAYYGEWIYLWPDETAEEDVKYYFGDQESFDELRELFIDIYKRYHADGLYDPDKETIEYAAKQDKILGLKPIEIIANDHIKEDYDPNKETDTVQGIFDIIVDPETINTIEVFDTSDDNEKLVYKGNLSEMPQSIKESKMKSFGLGPNEPLRCDIDSNAEDVRPLGSILANYIDNSGEVHLCDRGLDDCEYECCDCSDAVEKHGYEHIVDIQPPQVLKIFCVCPNLAEIKNNNEPDSPEDKLIAKIIAANGLSPYKVDKPLTNEYWIKESIIEKDDDLKIIYEQFVDMHDNDLKNEFKSVTGYKTELEEVAEKHGVDLSKLTEAKDACCEDSCCEESCCEEEVDNESNTAVDMNVNDNVQDTESESNDTVEEVVEEKETRLNVRNFKNRLELSKAVAECKNNNRPYKIKRSKLEGYRYELIEEIDTDNNTADNSSDSNENKCDCEPIETDNSNIIRNKICEIADKIVNIIKDTYDIKVEKDDVVNDLSDDINATLDETTNPKDVLDFLNGEDFSEDNLKEKIKSQRFIDAVNAGQIPYIPAKDDSEESDKEESSDEIDIDIEQFESDLNNYFDSNYEDTVYFSADEGSVDESGIITVKGSLVNEDIEKSVIFTFTPDTLITETSDNNTLAETLTNAKYKVTNNLSEEVFEFTFKK